MNKLTITPKGDREIVFTRQFNAPRQLVFDAHTKPAMLTRWLGVGVLDGWTFAVCDVDLRVGGSYRWVWRGPNGEEMGMRGTYVEIAPPDRLVTTERFDESWYEGGATGTMILTEKEGRTTMTTTMRYDSKAARDSVLASDMESGMVGGYNNLEAQLPAFAKETV